MTAFRFRHHLNFLTSFGYLCGARGFSRNLNLYSRNKELLLHFSKGLHLSSTTRSAIKFWRCYYYHQPKAFIMSSSRPSLEDIKTVKDKFLNMELSEKRRLYKCKDKYVTLGNILNWRDYSVKEEVKPVTVLGQKYEVNDELNSKVSVWSGDITALEIDSVVNAANSSLLGGSGVDGAIHSAAGRSLFEECRELKGCPEGLAKITGGYKLPCKYVIHTVGPQGEKPEILRSCYSTSLNLMVKNQLRSIAFPCVATGIYGYPRKNAAEVALQTVREFLEKNSDKIDRVIFTVFLVEDKVVYEELMQKYFPLQ